LILFLLILGILLQITLNGYSLPQIFINVVIGALMGSVLGSNSREDPNESPFVVCNAPRNE